MQAKDIRVGAHYRAKVSGKITTVRVDAVQEVMKTRYGKYNTTKRDAKVYHVTNLATGRKTTFRSAAKLREEVKKSPGPQVGSPYTAVKSAVANAAKKTRDSVATIAETSMEKASAPQTPISGICKRCGATVNVVNGLLESHKRPDRGNTCGASVGKAEDYLVEDEQRSDPTVKKSPGGRIGQHGTGAAKISGTPRGPSPSPSSTNSTRKTASGRSAVSVSVVPVSQPVKQPAKRVTSLAERLAEMKKERQEKERQQAVDNSCHIEVRALAGTGKTTTIVEGIKEVKGVKSSLTPSPQQESVWQQLGLGRTDTIRLSAFNTAITDELKERLICYGLDKQGVDARGIHSLGFSALMKAFGKQQPTNWAVQDRIGEALGGNSKDLKSDPKLTVLITATDDLVSLCKQTMSEPTPENLDLLCSHYDVDTNTTHAESSKERIYELVAQVLGACKKPNGKIAFDDMVWLPIIHELPIYKVDCQIIDESQDLNRMQQQLMYRSGQRIVFVGDMHQAIYGFAGADAESMQRLNRELSNTPRGCMTLPLTVTRRCGKAIVTEAKKIVPEFEAHSSNCLGSILQARYPVQKSSGQLTGGVRESQELPWDESYCKLVEPGDMVICRVNAPLVSQCFRFLKKGLRANILGRKIGEGLVAMVNKSKAKNVPDLISWLGDWLERETTTENAKKYPSEQRLIALSDKHDCLVVFCEGLREVTEVQQKIDSVFTDDKSRPGIKLSSIHKSKGLEAKRVFLLEPEGATVPHPMAKKKWEIEQEYNLRYVAITRAIEQLVFVS